MQVDQRQGDDRTVAERLLPAARRLVDWCAPDRGERMRAAARTSGRQTEAGFELDDEYLVALAYPR